MSRKPVFALALLGFAFLSLAPHAAPAQITAAPAADPDETIAVQGMRLSDAQAQALELALTRTPDDLTTRARLIGYYSSKHFSSDTARQAYERHALWIIAHRPDARFAGSGMMDLFPQIDGDAYAQAQALWAAAVKAHPTEARVLGNAAQFSLLSDRATAENLLMQAQTLEPKSPAWPSKLGELYTLSLQSLSGSARVAQAQKAMTEYETAYPLENADGKDAMLPDLAKTAYEAAAYDKAQTYADLMLRAATDAKHWNYGNELHFGNLVLGRLALQRGNITAGNQYLLAAGKTPGSPQLDSFSPNMTLARDLLARGQRGTVLRYFQECKTFWTMGREKLADWTAEVKGGVPPKFGANLDY